MNAFSTGGGAVIWGRGADKKKTTRHRVVLLEQVMGIEPTSQAWEARILPMNYTRKCLFIITDHFGKIKRILDVEIFK